MFIYSTDCVGFNVLVEVNDGFVIGHRGISANVILSFYDLYSFWMLGRRRFLVVEKVL